MTYKY